MLARKAEKSLKSKAGRRAGSVQNRALAAPRTLRTRRPHHPTLTPEDLKATLRQQAQGVYVVDGERIIGFDNERGKGDHKHVGACELPYQFVGVDRLIDDFQAEVERWKSAH